jgi:hypothetical protein
MTWVIAAAQVVLLALLAPGVVGVPGGTGAIDRAGGRLGQPGGICASCCANHPQPADAGTFFAVAPPVLMATAMIAATAGHRLTWSPDPRTSSLWACCWRVPSCWRWLAGCRHRLRRYRLERGDDDRALVEPTLLLAVFALSARVDSTSLGAIITAGASDPSAVFNPASLLAFFALTIATLAETARIPVDNPSTHLELTMVHEAMILEYSGRDLALVEWASAINGDPVGPDRQPVLPWGVAPVQAGSGGGRGVLRSGDRPRRALRRRRCAWRLHCSRCPNCWPGRSHWRCCVDLVHPGLGGEDHVDCRPAARPVLWPVPITAVGVL